MKMMEAMTIVDKFSGKAVPVHLQFVILADDLTGALDSGVEFANAGFRVIAATHPGAIDEALAKQPDILVVNSASREGSAAAARALHAAFRERFDAYFPDRIFKKVDSRLKGNIVHELNGLIGDSGAVDMLCSSAIPEMGRVCVDGHLRGEGIDAPIAVAERLAGTHGVVTVPDCRAPEDLAAAVASGGTGRLLVGARGLAHAVARQMASNGAERVLRPNLSGPLFAFIGSRDPITLAQVEQLVANSGLRYHHLNVPNGRLSEAVSRIDGNALMQLTQGESEEDRALVGQRFVELSAHFVKQKQHDSILACGGETAQGLLEALGIGSLEIRGELYPGVPVSSASFDRWTFSLITKSGGFGEADLLANLFRLTTPSALTN